jgi:hypothetical protein
VGHPDQVQTNDDRHEDRCSRHFGLTPTFCSDDCGTPASSRGPRATRPAAVVVRRGGRVHARDHGRWTDPAPVRAAGMMPGPTLAVRPRPGGVGGCRCPMFSRRRRQADRMTLAALSVAGLGSILGHGQREAGPRPHRELMARLAGAGVRSPPSRGANPLAAMRPHLRSDPGGSGGFAIASVPRGRMIRNPEIATECSRGRGRHPDRPRPREMQ